MTKRTREIITFMVYSFGTLSLGAAIAGRSWGAVALLLPGTMYFAYRMGRGEED